MIVFESEYYEFITQNGVGKNDKVASSTNSYISYLNSVSRLIREDISPKNLYDESCVLNIANRLLEEGSNYHSVSNFKSAMRQYVRMVEIRKLKK